MVEADVANMNGWQLAVGIVLTIALIACVPWLLGPYHPVPKTPVIPTMKMVTPSSVGL